MLIMEVLYSVCYLHRFQNTNLTPFHKILSNIKEIEALFDKARDTCVEIIKKDFYKPLCKLSDNTW